MRGKQAEQDRLILGKLESTGILAGGIAHDFNNLLTGMLLNLDMAQMRSGSIRSWPCTCAKQRRRWRRRKFLTDQLITFARGGASVTRPTNLAACCGNRAARSIGSTSGKEISIAADLWSAEVDSGQISQVVRNLVLNAREAMPEGGGFR